MCLIKHGTIFARVVTTFVNIVIINLHELWVHKPPYFLNKTCYLEYNFSEYYDSLQFVFGVIAEINIYVDESNKGGTIWTQ